MIYAHRGTAGGGNVAFVRRKTSPCGHEQQRCRMQAFNPIPGGDALPSRMLSLGDVSTEVADPSGVVDVTIGTGVPNPSPLVDAQSQFASVGIIDSLSNVSLEDMLSNVVDLVPFEPLQGFLSMVGTDIIGLVTLHPSLVGVLRILGLYYLVFARPSPFAAIIDFYILGPVSKLLGARFSESDFTLRDRLGNGNYGQGRGVVYWFCHCYCSRFYVCIHPNMQCMRVCGWQRAGFLI